MNRLLLALSALVAGCASQPNTHWQDAFADVQLTACEALAVAEADKRATRECPVNDGPWAACSAAKDIEIELWAALEDCD